MQISQANNNVQVVVDQYGCVQYVSKYVTTNEAGTSRLLNAVNEQSLNLK